MCVYVYMCCKGVVFQTIQSSDHAQGASLQTTEKTTNEAFLNILFSKSDLQKMFIQFTALDKKMKHLVSYSTSIQ